MRFSKAFLFLSACALNVSAQTLHTDNLQYKPFGFQKKLVVPAREVSYSRGFIYNDKVYFCAAPQSMERKGFEDRDSTYIYDPKKHTLVSANNAGYFLNTSEHLYRFNLAKDGDNKKNHNVYLQKTAVSASNLAETSTTTVHEFVCPTKKNKDCYSLFCYSPDSTFLAHMFYWEPEKNADPEVYITTYNAKTDESNTVHASVNYTPLDIEVNDKGESFLLTGKEKSMKVLKFTDNGKEAVYSQQISFDFVEVGCTMKWLQNNRMLFTYINRTSTKRLENLSVNYDIVDMDKMESVTGGFRKIVLADDWKTKQAKELADYNDLCLSDIVETEDGHVYFLGYPYSIKNWIQNNNNYQTYSIVSFGGMYVVSIDKDGNKGDTKFLNRYCSKEKVDWIDMEDRCMEPQAFAYGNNIYVIYNESIKKIQDSQSKKTYEQGDEDFHILLQRYGEDGEKSFDLTPSAAPEQAFSRIVAQNDNIFYFGTRANKSGSIYSVELPAVKSAAKKGTSAKQASTAAQQTTDTPASTGGKKRTVKK